jgi:hypothetical protein
MASGAASARRFSKSLGFTPDEVVSLGKRLEHDGPGPA